MIARVADRQADASAEVVRGQPAYDLGAIAWRRLEVPGALPAITAAAERVLSAPAAQATSA